MFNFFNTNTDDTPPKQDANPAPEDTVNKDTPPPEGLDKFAFLLDNNKEENKDKTGEEEKDTPFDPTELLSNDEALNQLLSNLDFKSAISEETQEKLANNAPDGIVALVNDVAKQSYKTALQHSSALNKKYVEDVLNRNKAEVSKTINSHINDRELASMLPEVKNPLVALGINPMVDKMRAQNPSMTTSDIASQVKEYLKELNATINPADTPNVSKDTDEGIDWLEELGLNS